MAARRDTGASHSVEVPHLEERLAALARERDALAARLEAIVESVGVGVVVLRSDGHVEIANRAALDILGVSRDELEGLAERQAWRVLTPDGRVLELDERPIFKALKLRTATLDGRFIVEKPDGTRLRVELSAMPLRAPQGEDSVVVTMRDVTESERREQAEREFVTNAAHELQTPITAIASAVDVLQSGAKEQPADRDRFLEHAERATERLGRLTRALLVLARAQGAEPPRREIVLLAPFLDDLARRASGPVTSTCEPDLAAISNSVLLEQALTNLIENAINHAKTPVAVVATRRGADARVEVRDTGPGIDVAIRQRVFDRFVRGEGSGGFGLGLAITRETVAAMGGELELDTDGTGTRVSVVLPGAKVRAT